MQLIINYHIEDILSHFKDICDFKVTLPCAQHLWDVNIETESLDNVKDGLFYLLTAKLLYITKKTKPDIEPYVEFLTTRIVKSNVYDPENLIICTSYLNQTVDNVKIIMGFNLTYFFT